MHTRTFHSQLIRIEELARALDNLDSIASERAAGALVDRRPAYWSRATYHDQVGTQLRSLANLPAGFRASVDAYDRDFPYRAVVDGRFCEVPRLSIEALDRMIPLNAAAIEELSKLYVEFGTFRTRDELSRREDRALGSRRAA